VPAILLRFLPHLIALGLVVGAVAYVHQRAYNRGQADIQAEWDADKALQLEDYNKRLKDSKDAAEGFQNELKDLRDYVSTVPPRVVRLCPVPRNSPDTSGRPGTDEAPAGAGELQEAPERNLEPGPDIGPDLEKLADDADEIVAQARGLQNERKALTSRPQN
jgi:hypothetical protein